jgi:hypothetical protein
LAIQSATESTTAAEERATDAETRAAALEEKVRANDHEQYWCTLTFLYCNRLPLYPHHFVAFDTFLCSAQLLREMYAINMQNSQN